MKKEKIIIATIKSWNINNAHKFSEMYRDKYDTFIFINKEDLNYEVVRDINPKYIFSPHWSWIIPKNIFDNFKCVLFHMTDLPYGRGGSPLQNLIMNKVYDTKISAIRVDSRVDTGKIYLKEDFYIGLGSAEEIFKKASEIIFFKMIPFILENNPIPIEQKGGVLSFKRRKPEESNIAHSRVSSLDDLYDFIRMLDAEGYPNAFLKIDNLKIIFTDIHKKQNCLEGKFRVIYEE